MRLYKDVKIELKLNITIDLSEIFTCSIKIKKYAGKTTIESIDSPYTKEEYDRLIRDINIQNIIYNHIRDDSISITNQDNNRDTYKRNAKEFEELSRTEGKLKVKYESHVTSDLTLLVYGRLYFKNGSEFEDCFETRSGLTIDSMVNTSALTKLIKDALPDHDLNINIVSNFEDDVKLLPNDEDFVDALYANKSDIMSAIEEDLNYKMYGNPDEE